MLIAVKGLQSSAAGIVECWVSHRAGSYDHKRCSQLPSQSRRHLPVWDFKVVRSDGSSIYLHPQWKGNKIDATEEDPCHPEPRVASSLPANGPGTSDGHGTYQKHIRQNRTVVLKFAPPGQRRTYAPQRNHEISTYPQTNHWADLPGSFSAAHSGSAQALSQLD